MGETKRIPQPSADARAGYFLRPFSRHFTKKGATYDIAINVNQVNMSLTADKEPQSFM